MSTIKKGCLTQDRLDRRHLRYWGKRAFWRRERRAARAEASNLAFEPAADLIDPIAFANHLPDGVYVMLVFGSANPESQGRHNVG